MVEPEPSPVAEPELTKTERRLYVSFFDNLGISDEKQIAFLATLLRNVFEASSKLDSHLAPHGAALHSAVSRMQVSDNPRDAPTHRWIRVVDRLGFFSDTNSHAERIVNVGLSFAYRHLEVDALAEANAMLLRQVQPAATAAAEENPDGGATAALTRAGQGGGGGSTGGGVGGGGGTGAESEGLPPIDAPMEQDEADDEERALPPGGMAFSNLPPLSGLGAGTVAGLAHPAAASAGGSIVTAFTTTRARAVGGTPTGGVTDQEEPLPPGGVVFAPSNAAAAAVLHAGGQAASAADVTPNTGGGGGDAEEEEDHVGSGSTIPPHVIYDRQPTVVPNEAAVKLVESVLEGVQDRSDGISVLRQLLDDSVLVLGRSSSRPATKPNGKVWPSGVKGDRMALARRTDGWWPQWRAPQDLPNSIPPVGTVAYAFNRNRASASSRWVILIDMGGINDTIKGLSIRSARYFPKDALVPVEKVQRLWGKAPMRFPVVVACMLLLVTKEEGYGTTLADLAAAGRATIPKNTSLLSASCHEFNTSGIAAPAAPTGLLGGPPDGSPAAQQLPDHPRDSDAEPDHLSQQYAEMEVALASEDLEIKTQNRAHRARVRNAKTRASTTAARAAAPVARSTPGANVVVARPAAAASSVTAPSSSTASASTGPTRLPARPRARSGGTSAPLRPAKRPRTSASQVLAGGSSAAAAPAGQSAGAAPGAGSASVVGGSGGVPVGAATGGTSATVAGGPVGYSAALVRLVVAPTAAPPGGATGAVPRPRPPRVPVHGGAGPVGPPAGGGRPPIATVAVPRTGTPSAPDAGNLALVGGGCDVVAASNSAEPPPASVSAPLSPLLYSSASVLSGSPAVDTSVISAPSGSRSAAEFAEEHRQRRARVESDLRDAQASRSAVLSDRHESWTGGKDA